jgi:hypothetical protein
LDFEYPKGVRFECTRCPICCGDTEKKTRSILLLRIEAERIARKTLMTIDAFADEIEDSEPYVYRMKKTANGKCVFLVDNSCSIYRTRPVICRFYPFQLTSTRGKYTFTYTDECPSVGKSALLRKEYFRRLFNELSELVKEDKDGG